MRALLAHQPPEAIEVAVLLTSELVTNAVIHGNGDTVIDIEMCPERDRVRVSVTDDSKDLPFFQRPSAERNNGRGIAIVDHFSQAWGVERRPDDGKSVWFELRLPHTS